MSDIRTVRLDQGALEVIGAVLDWVDNIGCERAMNRADARPCRADDADLCIPCAASYMLGAGAERHAAEDEEHRRAVAIWAAAEKGRR